MPELLIHPTSQKRIETYLLRPTHALLLSGPAGIGLGSIAHHIATQIDAHAYIHDVTPDDKHTITIEAVRSLYKLTRSQRETALVVIIDDAEAMSREAQNALLKLLEEPVAHVYFILTTHIPQQLLATVTSRTQHITLTPLARGTTDQLFASQDDATRAQIRFLADGLPAEVTRLAGDETYLMKQTKLTRDARHFLEGDTYARLLLAKEYGTDREQAEALLASLTMLLSFMLFERHATDHITLLEHIEQIRTRLQQNAHVRTQLAYLVTLL